jgi:3-mercaptopyruvate sulfurtransferase SseA
MKTPTQSREQRFERAIMDTRGVRTFLGEEASVLHDELRLCAELLDSAIGGHDPGAVLAVHAILMERESGRLT